MAVRCRVATDEEIQRGHATSLTYLGEGAANVVFACKPTTTKILVPYCMPIICTTEAGEWAEPLSDVVLRFSKTAKNAPSCRAIAAQFDDVPRRFFEGETKQHCAYKGILEVDAMVINCLNTILLHLDNAKERKASCVDTRIRKDDLYCLLLPNLTAQPGKFMTVEIKPKWLLQSPSAPRFSLRCRTCALRAQRAAKGDSRRLMMDHGNNAFCPLTLVSEDYHAIASIFVERLRHTADFSTLSPPAQSTLEKLIADYFTIGDGRALLLKLKLWQKELDPTGFPSNGFSSLGFDPKLMPPTGMAAERLKVAMTFRDCSMFVCVHYGVEEPFVQAFLVDLDPKVDGKMMEWVAKERLLVHQGWYLGRERDMKPEDICVLAKQMKREVPWWI